MATSDDSDDDDYEAKIGQKDILDIHCNLGAAAAIYLLILSIKFKTIPKQCYCIVNTEDFHMF